MEPSQEEAAPTRVLRLFSRLNVGGPSIHVILLTAGLVAKGYKTRLVLGMEAPHEGNLLDLAAEKGVACEAMASLGREIRPLQDIRAFFELYRLMRAYRPQVVHTHAAKAGLLGRMAARARRSARGRSHLPRARPQAVTSGPPRRRSSGCSKP